MNKLLIVGLLLAGLLIVYGCASPSEGEELPGEEKGALAGLAISLGCQTYSRGVTSCTTNVDGSISVATRTSGRTSQVVDMCRRGVVYDYSCIPGKAGSASIAYRLCRTQCESAEDCVNAQCLSRCGNGRIDAGETCGTCAADVLCMNGEICQEGICIVPCTIKTEVCDGEDNSCDGVIDESGVCNTIENCGVFANACVAGQSCQAGVCTTIAELCDNADNNANGQVDEGCDDDNDNYCDSAMTLVGTPTTCTAGGGDCDDAMSYINPYSYTSTEGSSPRDYRCTDNVDNDCDGVIDDGCPENLCDDIDNNGNGIVDEGCDDDGDNYCDNYYSNDNANTIGAPAACPNGGGDCADYTDTINPGVAEYCFNYNDDNCNGVEGEGCSAPYTCTETESSIEIRAASGQTITYTDSCGLGGGINATRLYHWTCVADSGSDWRTIIGQSNITCSGTCQDSDGSTGATPAVCP